MARAREALETTALLERTKLEMEKLGSDISSSEDELLTGGDRIENHYSPIDGSPRTRAALTGKMEVKDIKDDDQMSLSSLSSGEQKIEESKEPVVSSTSVPTAPPPTFAFQSYTPYPGKLISKNYIFLCYRKSRFQICSFNFFLL